MKGNKKGKKNGNSKKNIAIVAVIALIGILSVGYGALTTTLNISGTANISKVGWDVHFANVSVTSGSVTATTPATINSATTAINYVVTLNKPGDYYEFTVDVVNGGTLAAKLSNITLGGLTSSADVYTNYTVKYSDGTTVNQGDTIAAGASKTLRVRVEFDKNITNSQLPSSATTLSLTVATTYVQV